MHKQFRRGFTIVEILVVVVIISILVLITATIYQNAQVQARDTQVRDAAAKFAEAIKLWSANNGGISPLGGWVAAGTTSTPDGASGCTGGGTSGWQNANMAGTSTNYPCTVGSVVVNAGLLSSDLFTKLPNTVKYGNNTTNFMVYRCSGSMQNRVLMYALEDPTPKETQDFTDLLTSCSLPLATYTGYGMSAGILMKL